MARRIPKNVAKSGSKIPAPDVGKVLSESVTFSFKYLDLASNEKFSISRWPKNGDWANEKASSYLDTLLDRLKSVSGMRISEFQQSRSPALRSHAIKWGDTSEPDGFTGLNDELKEMEAWQFQLTANEHGRVHGFLLDKCFCVVWLDPFHRLYP